MFCTRGLSASKQGEAIETIAFTTRKDSIGGEGGRGGFSERCGEGRKCSEFSVLPNFSQTFNFPPSLR